MPNLFKDLLTVADQPVSITGTSAAVANPIVVTTGAAHGFANGDMVLIAGVSPTVPAAFPEVNGVHTVSNVTPFTFEINLADPLGTDFPIVAGVGGEVVNMVGPTVDVSDMEEAKTIVSTEQLGTIRNFELQADDGVGSSFVKIGDFVASVGSGDASIEPLSESVFHLEATTKKMRVARINRDSTGTPSSVIVGAKAA